MQPMMPTIEVPGDLPNRIMARSGKLVGFSKTRFVWSFGCLAGSNNAKAFGCHSDDFLWVLADRAGNVFLTHFDPNADTLSRFLKVLESNPDEEVYDAANLLIEAAKVIREDLDAAGGCDHAVGICQCGTENLFERIQVFLKETGMGKETRK